MATKEEEEKAAAEKAAADAKAEAERDKGPSPEERKAAEERRAAESKAQAERLDAADKKAAQLEETIKSLKTKLEAGEKKGDDKKELEQRLAEAERRLVDNEKTVLELHEREKQANDRANSKTLETDLRAALGDKLVDAAAVAEAVDSLIARKKARVDSDGKVAIVDEKGNWGSLSAEAVLKHVHPALQKAKGVPGSGDRGPAGEVVTSDVWERGKVSQADFEKLQDEGKLPRGDGRHVRAQ